MLKIKENRLKDLKQYGFDHIDCCDDIWYTHYYNPDNNIRIQYSDREIDTLSVNVECLDQVLEMIYKMTKDGMIEE